MQQSSTTFLTIKESHKPHHVSVIDAMQNFAEGTDVLSAKEITEIMLRRGLTRTEMQVCLSHATSGTENRIPAIAEVCRKIQQILRVSLSQH